MRNVFLERAFAGFLFLLLWLYYRWLERADAKKKGVMVRVVIPVVRARARMPNAAPSNPASFHRIGQDARRIAPGHSQPDQPPGRN